MISPEKPLNIVFITDPYIEPLLEGAVRFAREKGWLLRCGMRRTGVFPHFEKVDGVIATINHPETLRRIQELRAPTIQILDILEGTRQIYPTVVPDYAALGALGAKHLMRLGRPHFAFYRRFDSPDSNAIRESFVKTMAAHHHRVISLDYPTMNPGHPSGIGETLSTEEWERVLAGLLSRLPRPCAIMAEDDRFGVQLIRLALSVGLRVPEDIAVLGCDEHHPEVDMALVPMSSVNSNLQNVGYRAAALLHERLCGRPVATGLHRIPPKGVVSRHSTALFICEDKRIGDVICKVRSEYSRDLSITEMAREAGMSLRKLQIDCKSALGYSLREELIRCRFSKAENLLAESDLKVSTIALESGFGDARNMTRFFRIKHKLTPQAWRQLAQSGNLQLAD
jgi:LacI family transcriptional regulator